jgi:hypothetical protein
MALTKVHNRMISQSVVNVRDFGAIGDGIADDGAAIQAAIIYARDNSNVVGSGATTGKSRNIVYFPPGVYLTKQTLTFYTFINYEGMRATTVDAGADTTDQSDSRGSIIRADVAIYNDDNDTDGVLVYIPTGDITIRGLTFVGTAQINSNSSIGLQWASAGGTATTGRPHESIDGTGQNCSGVSVEYCSFYTFTKAWECNCMNDAYHYQVRFESNTTDVQFAYNPNVNNGQSAKFSHSIFFGHSVGMSFSQGTKYTVYVDNSAFDNIANSTQHLVFTSTTASDFNLKFTAVEFDHSGSSCFHALFGGNYDSKENDILFNGCSFKGDATNRAAFKVERGSGTAAPENFAITNCTFKNSYVNFNIARECSVMNSRFKNGYINQSTSNRIDVFGNVFADYSGTGITVATADCGYSYIRQNRFENVTTPISIFNNSTNDTIICENNLGVSASPARGKFVDFVNGITFANLGTPADGSIVYCTDGTSANPVAGSGTGCIAKRLNSVWVGN